MSRSDEIKKLLRYSTNQVFKIIELIIERVPEENLTFKPSERSMSFGHLAVHLYNMCYLYIVGPVSGSFVSEDFDDLFCDPRKVTTKDEIINYANLVKAKISNSLEFITDGMLDNEVEFDFTLADVHHFTHGWGKWKLGSYSSLFSILEESIHHRGQLNLYLRIMGVEPVFVYE